MIAILVRGLSTLWRKSIQVFLAIAIFIVPNAQLHAQGATLALSDVPLFLIENVAPNLAITFDDSGSMLWGYLPDSIQWTDGAAGNLNRAATKSNFYNKMYYDPSVDYRPGLNSAGVSLGEASFTNAFTNIYNYGADGGGNWRPVSVNLQTNFRPVWNASTVGGWGPQHSGPNFEQAYYFNRDDSRAGCDGTNFDNDCYVRVNVSATSGPARPRPEFGFAVSTDERTNFANWYQYYSYRFIAGKTVLSRAFAPENLSSAVRVGRQTINQRTIRSGNPGATNAGGNAHVAPFNATQRANFYQWLSNVRNNGGTPLREAIRTAGNYFSTTGTNSPYSVSPGTGGADQVSCRLNAHIMLSDGYWNGGGGGAGGITRDQTNFNLPDGTNYDPNSTNHNIFADNQATVTLADLAFHYWATDLSPLTNNVSSYFPQASGDPTADYWNPMNDPATWQHMVTYPIAFGIAGLIPFNSTSYDALIDGTPFTTELGVPQTGWTTVGVSEGRADDMWHSAINSRGQFFSASNPDELVNSLVSVMNAIAARESSAASVDLNSSSISAGIGVFQAKFVTDDWSGDLLGRPLSDGSGSNSCNSQAIGSACSPSWNVAGENTSGTLFPGGTDNRIVFTSDTAGGGKPFQWLNLSSAQQAAIRNGDTAVVGQQRVDYIRGSAANEERNGGNFRNRGESRVGAIVHSSPEYVSNGFDANGEFDVVYPDDIEIGSNTHRNFVCAGASDSDSDGIIDTCTSGIHNTREAVVYVGSNDGMLHVYDARLGNNGGAELFSFVPDTVIENLHELTNPTFVNGAFVDGSLDSADVFYGGNWHSVLVGGLRTGGQAYYALDITNPNLVYNFNSGQRLSGTETTTIADQLIRWEFTDTNTTAVADGALGANGDRDLGFTFGRPQIVKSNYGSGPTSTGRWVAIFGNGYNSTFADGSASTSGHAVVYVVDIETGTLIKKLDTGIGSPADPNGINGVAPILNDTDLTVDYIYAGDLHGNLWKFDITASNPDLWGSALGANAPLFTASSGGVRQPIQSTPRVSRHSQGGNQIYFGTGRYLQDSDNSDTSQQSFYGIYDRDDGSVVNPSLLQTQTVTVDVNGIRETSNNVINWSTQHGWVVNFPTSDGERSIGTPVLRGEIVIFTTLEPDDSACDSGGSSWIYALDRIDGGPPPVQVFDHNGDGEIDSSDYNGVSSATQIDAVISDPTVARGENGKDYVIYGSSDLGGAGGGIGSGATRDTTIEGRVRWRQLN